MHKDTVFGAVNLRKVKRVRLSVALDTPTMIVDKRVKGKVLELLSYKYDKMKANHNDGTGWTYLRMLFPMVQRY